MGAMLGSAFGQVAHAALPGLTAPGGAYALVGMGAVFAGAPALRSPPCSSCSS